MTTLEWKDPPARYHNHTGSRESKYDLIGVELRGRPNEWAMVLSNKARSNAPYIAKRLGEDFEVVCRGNDVYARCIR